MINNLIQKLIKDTNYQINSDGTIFTCINFRGNSSNIWRELTGIGKLSYYRQNIPISRIIFFKFGQEIPSSYLIKHKNKDIKDNRFENLYCPKLNEEQEIHSNLKICSICLIAQEVKNFDTKFRKKRIIGLKRFCKSCWSKKGKEHYNNNRNKIIQNNRLRIRSKTVCEYNDFLHKKRINYKNKTKKIRIKKPFIQSKKKDTITEYNCFLKERGIKPIIDINLSVDLRTQSRITECLICKTLFQKRFGKRTKYCSKFCVKTSSYLTNYYNNATIGEIKKDFSKKGIFRSMISAHARLTFKYKNKIRQCSSCCFNIYVEVCHKKPISEFSDSDLLVTVNNPSNLEFLCPNHHTKLDKKTFVLKKIRENKSPNRFYSNKIGHIPIKDRTRSDKKTNKYDSIRNNARSIIINSDRPLSCGICQEAEVLEICHLKPISEFSPDDLIRDVNSLTNLVLLCPNHHWCMDHEKLTPEEQSKLANHKKEHKID